MERDHLLVPSSSLVPYKDPSVLLTTAGMQQFKPYFMGLAEPPSRAADERTEVLPHLRHRPGGSHRAPLHVLRDAGQLLHRRLLQGRRHPLRLGVLPATTSSWTASASGSPTSRATTRSNPTRRPLAFWEALGMPRERMVGLPRSDNFWGPVGPRGPCGPCSELYYDRGPQHGLR